MHTRPTVINNSHGDQIIKRANKIEILGLERDANGSGESRDSLVSAVTAYGLDDRGSIPGSGEEFLSSPPRPDRI
jgi:hypothetical protein